MDKNLREYIISERFIHDMLLEKCENLIKKVRDDWDTGTKPLPVLLTWPAETVKSDEGRAIDDVCVCYLGTDKQRWPGTMRNMVARTRAYGLAVLDPSDTEIRLLFESMHGTRTWTIPIQRHGDMPVLGEAQCQDDVGTVGLLWNRKKASS